MEIDLRKYYIITAGLLLSFVLSAQRTEVIYLSGTGSDHTVDWQFFCTEGRNSGIWTTIPVPSNWELQGFGEFNYGSDRGQRGKEHGLYKYSFIVPAAWKGENVHIIFEGSMTDTKVAINGRPAGAIHQGSFYRFQYDISRLLVYGDSNILEVDVAKHSDNNSVNRAERYADYWIFGGIYRPVYLEAKPVQHIERVAINAEADGTFEADVYLDGIRTADQVMAQVYTLDGKKWGDAFYTRVQKGDKVCRITSSLDRPLSWTPESPNLYQVKFTLTSHGKSVHEITERFGFRTIEIRLRDGIYVNGTKIKFKGVCRHSFRPSTGRALCKDMSIEDVNLMKDMNMNAVRMSHYPPDGHFLDVCDSLGLFVLDELAGWHDAYDDEIGPKLVAEFVTRDVNHPSVIMWDNGNESGHNYALDPLFNEFDIQKRPVIHPWEVFNGFDTQHYINYDYGNGTHLHGHDIVFPTEFLHGLYDGGHGAGLYDFWEQMWNHPRSAGGFLWVFADEGVVRVDRNGEIDTDGTHAPDGILGPFHEKEASFFTIKEVWTPVRFEMKDLTSEFDGKLKIENRYFFTNINQCTFSFKLLKVQGAGESSGIEKTGAIRAPDIHTGQKGCLSLELPDDWYSYDILYVTGKDKYNREIYTWSWPVSLPERVCKNMVKTEGPGKPAVSVSDSLLAVEANGITISLNRHTGLLYKVENSQGVIPFNNGPVLCEGEADFRSMDYRFEGNNILVSYVFGRNSRLKELTWIIFPSGWIKLDVKYMPAEYESAFLGVSFSYPENEVTSVKWLGDGPYRVWKNRMEGVTLGVWEKEYNRTITGVSPLIYPEFKGYHSGLYWARIQTKKQPFTVTTETEDVFLRLFTPDTASTMFNTAPSFPSGDISFMQAIPPIGTKTQIPENLGPSGKKNMYFDYGPYDNWRNRCKKMVLYFDFSGK